MVYSVSTGPEGVTIPVLLKAHFLKKSPRLVFLSQSKYEKKKKE